MVSPYLVFGEINSCKKITIPTPQPLTFNTSLGSDSYPHWQPTELNRWWLFWHQLWNTRHHKITASLITALVKEKCYQPTEVKEAKGNAAGSRLPHQRIHPAGGVNDEEKRRTAFTSLSPLDGYIDGRKIIEFLQLSTFKTYLHRFQANKSEDAEYLFSALSTLLPRFLHIMFQHRFFIHA